MFSIVLLSVLGLTIGQTDIALPNGHDLRTAVDSAFGRLDRQPKDGNIDQAEFNAIVLHDDTDKNGCVSLAEFEAATTNMADELAMPLFNHFNVEHNDCLNVADLQLEFHKMDHDSDGIVNLHEFEVYYSKLLRQMFGHNTNTHGHQA